MDGRQAQEVLTVVSITIGFVGFFGSLAWHHLRHRGEYDWVEVLARSAFVWLQFALWGAVAGFIVLGQVYHVWYGAPPR